jgi:hypothetical protein
MTWKPERWSTTRWDTARARPLFLKKRVPDISLKDFSAWQQLFRDRLHIEKPDLLEKPDAVILLKKFWPLSSCMVLSRVTLWVGLYSSMVSQSRLDSTRLVQIRLSARNGISSLHMGLSARKFERHLGCAIANDCRMLTLRQSPLL